MRLKFNFKILMVALLVSNFSFANTKAKSTNQAIRDGYTTKNVARYIFTGKCGGIVVLEENKNLLNVHFFRKRVLDIKNNCSTAVTLSFPHEVSRLNDGSVQLKYKIFDPSRYDLGPSYLDKTTQSTLKIPISFTSERSEGIYLDFEDTSNYITWGALNKAGLLAKKSSVFRG